MNYDDLYKDENEKREEENDDSEQEQIPVKAINDINVLEMIMKKLRDNAIYTMNYANAIAEGLKYKGIYVEPVSFVKKEEKQITISITFEIKGISKEKLEELEEIAQREKYLKQLRGKPRGVHTKKAKKSN